MPLFPHRPGDTLEQETQVYSIW